MKNIRQGLGSFASDLEGAALNRHRQLQEKLTPALQAHYNVSPKNLPGVGPATVMGNTYVSPQTGTAIRELVEGSTPRRLAATAVMASGQDVPKPLYERLRRPEDASITNSVIKHELAEQRMMQSKGHGVYPGNPFASHLGPSADMAERLGQRDPRAVEVMTKARAQLGKDDPRAATLMRQHGMVGNYVPPLGGRAHRSLESAIEQMPVNEGGMNRFMMGSPAKGQARTALEYGQRAGQLLQKIPHATAQSAGAHITESMNSVLSRPNRFRDRSPEQVSQYIGHLSGLGPLPEKG